MKTTTAMLALSLFLLLDAAPTAQASIIFITTDTTINTGPAPTGTVVGYSSNANAANMTDPTSPTVSLVTGGSTGSLIVYNDSVFTMTGGNTAGVNLHNNVSFSESGGTVGGSLSAGDNTLVSISGGSIGVLVAGGTSTVNLSGLGSVGSDLNASNTATVNITGGSVGGELNAIDGATINYSGGTVAGDAGGGIFGNILYYGADNSVLNLYGTGLSITYYQDGNYNNTNEYVLSGQLEDGTSLDGRFVYLGYSAQVNLFNGAVVPEPSSLTLMGLGVAGLAASAWRRRKRMARIETNPQA